MVPEESILLSIKKYLGIAADDSYYDEELVMIINSVFNTLTDMGLGPTEGFEITNSDAKWTDILLDDKLLNRVKTYVDLRTKIIFDPPSSTVLAAYKEEIAQLEWRIHCGINYKVTEEGS